VLRVWQWIVDQTSGLSFQQDSIAIEQAARLIVTHRKVQRALDDLEPTDPAFLDLTRQLLAIGRQVIALMGKLGLTPRDRQSLLRPSTETEEKDEFERLMEGRE